MTRPKRYVIRKRRGKWWLILNDRWHECRSWGHALGLAHNLQRLGIDFRR